MNNVMEEKVEDQEAHPPQTITAATELPVDNMIMIPPTEHCESVHDSSPSKLVRDIGESTESNVRDRSMCVIMPGTTSWAVQVIRTIKILDDFLSLTSTRGVIDEILNPTKGSKQKRVKKKKQAKNNNDVQDEQQPIQPPEIFDNPDAIESIRFIQAGRYEIFVKARGKKAYVFDWICQQVLSIYRQQQAQASDTEEFILYENPDQIKEVIVQYAIQQAERDGRINANIKNKGNVSYDNFSLIVSYDPVTAQPKHIDLLYPNYQYGLIITDQSPGTTVYMAPNSIQTVDDVKNYVWNDISLELSTAMEHDPIVTSLLVQFGDVLCPDIQQVKYWESSHDTVEVGEDIGGKLKESRQECIINSSTTNDTNDAQFSTGTLLSLPGSEIHAGPSSSKYRTVLFFSACPDVTNTIPYHPDTQYFAPLLCCDFICLLWNRICIADRIYLLHRLITSIKVTKCQHLERHIADAKMIRFLRVVSNWENKKDKTGCFVTRSCKYRTIDDYIQAFASRGKYTCIDPESIGINVVGATLENKQDNERSLQKTITPPKGDISPECQNMMNLMSCSSLVVDFDGKYFPAQVFEHRATSPTPCGNGAIVNISEQQNIVKVMLFYPEDQTWEGNMDPYTLEWKKEYLMQSTTSEEETHDIKMPQKCRVFDGTNGIIRDSDGCIVPCYPRCLTSVASQDNDSTIKKRKQRKSIIPASIRPHKRVKAPTIDKSTLAPPAIDKSTLTPPARSRAQKVNGSVTSTSNSIIWQNVTISETDVLWGKSGRSTSRYFGNMMYNAQVQSQVESYTKASMEGKGNIIYGIIRFVRDQGGRFLHLRKDVWLDLNDTDAYKKILSDFQMVEKSVVSSVLISDVENNDIFPTEVPKPSESCSSVGTAIINDADVLGGTKPTQHPGNKSFVELVKLFCSKFKNALKNDRVAICDEIIQAVHCTNGRFLRRDNVTGYWHELDNDEARNRCSRAFSHQIDQLYRCRNGGFTNTK